MVFQACLIGSKGVVAYLNMVVSAHRTSRPAAMMVIRSARWGGVGRSGSLAGGYFAEPLSFVHVF